jgi:hypothetical protein
LGHGQANVLFVVDDENRLLSHGFLLLRDWQGKGENTALTWGRFYPDRATVSAHDLSANGEPEARSARLLSLYLDEFLEDPGLIFRGDSRSIVTDRHVNLRSDPPRHERNMPALAHIPEGIGHQVRQHPGDLVGLGAGGPSVSSRVA